MNFFNKNRVVFWTLVVLVVINLSALASFFIFSGREPAGSVICYPSDKKQRAFSSELELTPEQTKLVSEINNNYRLRAEPLSDSIKERRATILSELEQDDPDTNYLRRVAQELSVLQMSLQFNNIRQYLELKKVCSAEQTHRLSALYRELYGCPMQEKAKKNRHQFRHGQH